MSLHDQPWYVVANWKMNKTCKEATQFVHDLIPEMHKLKYSLWIAAPFTALPVLHEMQENHVFVLGAQNMNDASEGAFTGEIAASMVKEVGAAFVLLGHSERRIHFHESDEFIAKKVSRAVQSELVPILCVGETLEEKKTNKTASVLERQLSAVLALACPAGLKDLIVAYEPVWAIGTGLSATPVDIEMAVKKIVETAEKFHVKVSVLYGGSVSPKNAEEIAGIPSIKGFLVGTASLQTESFAKIASLSENKRTS